MIKLARLGDTFVGVCSIHGGISGTIISASPDVFGSNKGFARLGDTGLATCGHTGVVATSSSNVHANSKGVARIGDSVIGATITASIVSGDPHIYVN
jgi:uncharacterized Zn-binding protein involved in type VI secretion